MLARLLRLSLLLQIAGGALLALFLLPAPWRYWFALPIGLLVPLVGTALVIALETLIVALIDPRVPRSRLRQALWVWLHESFVSTRAFSWRQPWFAGFPEPLVVHDPARPAVLLVHGYVCNRAVWKPLIDSRVLQGCNIATLNMEPVFGDIDRLAEPIAQAVDALLARSGAAQVVLVCHSMGGLAAGCYLRRQGDGKVARVITIATPHHGTIFGKLGRGLNAKQMAMQSSFVETLRSAYTPEQRLKFVCIATQDDNLVVPRSSPLLPGAKHYLIDGVGHLALVEDSRVWKILHEEILST